MEEGKTVNSYPLSAQQFLRIPIEAILFDGEIFKAVDGVEDPEKVEEIENVVPKTLHNTEKYPKAPGKPEIFSYIHQLSNLN
ncbi:hypothetical protein G9A89_015077 [Geosiphon pyriformis]|nr:hypothetical protein G9A89_015077 [Geosiphon pyriformis]